MGRPKGGGVNSEAQRDALIDAIYEASLGEGGWEAVLHGLRQAAGVRLVAMLSATGEDSALVQLTACEDTAWAERMRLAYNSEFMRHDPTIAVAGGWNEGRWYDNARHSSRAERSRSIYHQEYLRPNGASTWSGVFLQRDGTSQAFLSLLRGEEWDEASDADVRAVQSVLPHLQRAVRIQSRIGHLSRRAAAGDAALDGLALPTILLGEEREILLANLAAEQLMAVEPALRFVNGRFTPNRHTDAAAWRAACAAGEMKLESGKGDRLTLRLSPVHPRAALARTWQRPLTLMTIESSAVLPTVEQKLCLRYRLTKAEARLALMLGQKGLTPQECADALAVTIHTVRSQIKSIYAKLEIRRQAELVQVIVKLIH